MELGLGRVQVSSRQGRWEGEDRGGREGREEARKYVLPPSPAAAGGGRWLQVKAALVSVQEREWLATVSRWEGRDEAVRASVSTPFRGLEVGIERAHSTRAGGSARNFFKFPRYNSLATPNNGKRAGNSRYLIPDNFSNVQTQSKYQ
jgi:hypothetical protein